MCKYFHLPCVEISFCCKLQQFCCSCNSTLTYFASEDMQSPKCPFSFVIFSFSENCWLTSNYGFTWNNRNREPPLHMLWTWKTEKIWNGFGIEFRLLSLTVLNCSLQRSSKANKHIANTLFIQQESMYYKLTPTRSVSTIQTEYWDDEFYYSVRHFTIQGLLTFSK